MSATRKCRGCGIDVPANAPFGHCPKCLLELGFGPLPERLEGLSAEPPSGELSLGDYHLLEQIGRGGMGVIYKARQRTLNRLVAVKLVRPDELGSPALIQRFHLEAEAAASLHHPNIVPIYETGEHQGQHFFSMELIDGNGLDRYIGKGGFAFDGEEKPPRARHERIARIMAKVARAVDYAHQHGVLHRDLKPSNILLDKKREPHLTDFGVAKLIGHTGSGLTASGAIMGTPSYMAPEQAAGKTKRVTTAADTYSLGAILYEMLTGHPPFRADTPVETLKQVVEEDPRHPSTLKDSIDRDLATICMKCLDKEPQRRYLSAAALADDLERWLRKEPIEARRAGPVLRVRRWVQRNPAPALLIVSLCLGIAASLALLQFARKQSAEKDRALGVIKKRLDEQLNNLWLDTNRVAFERISAAELAAYTGLEWRGRGPTNKLSFGVYTYTRPARMLASLAPILLRLGNDSASDMGQRLEIDLVIYRSYDAALTALEAGRLHFMRMGPASYLQLKARSLSTELLASQDHSEPLTLAIFVRTNSSISSIANLRRKRFAFGDTNSTTGNHVAKWVLVENDLRQGDLAGFAHHASQQEVLNSVITGGFDAGAGNYDLVREQPELRTIGTFPLANLGLCWVAGPRLDPRFTNRLRKSLLLIKDTALLTNLESTVTGFQLLPDNSFDELRRIMRQADSFEEMPRLP